MSYLSYVPNDITNNIVQNIDIYTLIEYCQTNQNTLGYCNDIALWKGKLKEIGLDLNHFIDDYPATNLGWLTLIKIILKSVHDADLLLLIRNIENKNTDIKIEGPKDQIDAILNKFVSYNKPVHSIIIHYNKNKNDFSLNVSNGSINQTTVKRKISNRTVRKIIIYAYYYLYRALYEDGYGLDDYRYDENFIKIFDNNDVPYIINDDTKNHVHHSAFDYESYVARLYILKSILYMDNHK